MIADARGLDLSDADRNEVETINRFTACLLRLDNGVEEILEAARRSPASPMTRLLAGAFCLFGQTNPSVAAGAGHLAAVDLRVANERQRMLHAALTFWSRNDFLHAVEVLEDLTARWPADLLSAKFAEFLYYVLGQQHMGARFRAHMERIREANTDDPDYLGMAAFAAELCGDFSAAEHAAERALSIEPRNAWAQHALAHVLIRLGRVEEGKMRMEGFLPELAGCQRLIHSHDAWHLALLHLEELNADAALEVYHGHIWGFAPDLVGEQIDAIALLWRMELAGFPMDAEWSGIADHVEARVGEAFMPFLSAHHVYALVRAGREESAGKCVETVRERSRNDDEEGRRVWAGAGRAIVEATAEFARGDARKAVDLLRPAMPDMTRIGGSDAQDDLFRQMYLRALQRSGHRAEAAEYFDRISGDKIRTPLDRTLAA